MRKYKYRIYIYIYVNAFTLTNIYLNLRLAWNLINDMNKKETETMIEKYTSENRDLIAQNAKRQVNYYY